MNFIKAQWDQVAVVVMSFAVYYWGDSGLPAPVMDEETGEVEDLSEGVAPLRETNVAL